MKKYIALLRGVNIGGKNKISMVQLKTIFEEFGFKEVKTYLNSGNVIFSSNEDNMESLTKHIEMMIKNKFNLDIPVLIIHGNEDTKAPLSMAYKLYDSCRSEKEIYIVNGADHAENYQADPEKYGDIIIRFIKKHMSYSQKED